MHTDVGTDDNIEGLTNVEANLEDKQIQRSVENDQC
jgi:hypothetical protein